MWCPLRFPHKTMLGSSFLRYLCLLAYSGVQHILCYVFVLFVFLLCTLCCQFPWIVHFWVPLRYSLTFINTSEIERKLKLRLILLTDWFCRSLFFLLSAIIPLASSNSFHCLMLSISHIFMARTSAAMYTIYIDMRKELQTGVLDFDCH